MLVKHTDIPFLTSDEMPAEIYRRERPHMGCSADHNQLKIQSPGIIGVKPLRIQRSSGPLLDRRAICFNVTVLDPYVHI